MNLFSSRQEVFGFLPWFCSSNYSVCMCMQRALLRFFSMFSVTESVIIQPRRVFSFSFLNRKEKNFAVVTLGHQLRWFVVHLVMLGFCLWLAAFLDRYFTWKWLFLTRLLYGVVSAALSYWHAITDDMFELHGQGSQESAAGAAESI